MTNATTRPEKETLAYSRLRGAEQLSRHVSDDGVSYIARPVSIWPAVGAAMFAWLMMTAIGGAGYAIATDYKPTAGEKLGGAALIAVAAVTYVAILLILIKAFRRRKVPVCLGVLGDKLVLISPHLSAMRKEWPTGDIKELRLQKLVEFPRSTRANLQVRAKGRAITRAFSGLPIKELEPAVAELMALLRLATDASAVTARPPSASTPAADRSPPDAAPPTA